MMWTLALGQRAAALIGSHNPLLVVPPTITLCVFYLTLPAFYNTYCLSLSFRSLDNTLHGPLVMNAGKCLNKC